MHISLKNTQTVLYHRSYIRKYVSTILFVTGEDWNHVRNLSPTIPTWNLRCKLSGNPENSHGNMFIWAIKAPKPKPKGIIKILWNEWKCNKTFQVINAYLFKISSIKNQINILRKTLTLYRQKGNYKIVTELCQIKTI